MQTLSWSSITAYCLFDIFVFYQRSHVKYFHGASQTFYQALNISAIAGMLTGSAYLVYYGWSVVWWAPVVIYIVGLLASLPGGLLARVVGWPALSLVGFVGWPVSAYFMFHYIPR